jgi:hypothetical protein
MIFTTMQKEKILNGSAVVPDEIQNSILIEFFAGE